MDGWMNNCIYIVEVMYPSVCGFGKVWDLIEIRDCEKSEFPNCNSNGVWGYEKEGSKEYFISGMI